MSVAEHKRHAPAPAEIRIAVVTVSDTRTPKTDEGGRLIRELCGAAGFSVADETLLRDEPGEVAAHVRKMAGGGLADAVLLTGGTGISRRDSTIEAVAAVFDKTLGGYGELFRFLSYQEIGAAAMLSRATAGTIAEAVVFTMPGSPAAVRLALEKLILPELAHVVSELRRHGGPGDPHSHHGHGHHGHGHHR